MALPGDSVLAMRRGAPYGWLFAVL